MKFKKNRDYTGLGVIFLFFVFPEIGTFIVWQITKDKTLTDYSAHLFVLLGALLTRICFDP